MDYQVSLAVTGHIGQSSPITLAPTLKCDTNAGK
jgi:hypothetical protein